MDEALLELEGTMSIFEETLKFYTKFHVEEKRQDLLDYAETLILSIEKFVQAVCDDFIRYCFVTGFVLKSSSTTFSIQTKIDEIKKIKDDFKNWIDHEDRCYEQGRKLHSQTQSLIHLIVSRCTEEIRHESSRIKKTGTR